MKASLLTYMTEVVVEKKHEDVPEKVMLAKEKNSYLRSFEIFHDIKGQNVGS